MRACKALQPFRGRPLVAWTAGAMGAASGDVLVAAATGWARRIGAALPRAVRVVEDSRPGLGPVGGLEAGLRAARNPWVAVAPCDSPLVEPGLYGLLLAEAAGHDAAVPFLDGYPEPLHSVFRKRPTLAALERVISGGGGSVRDALRLLDVRRVGTRKLLGADPLRRSFWNLGTREALRRAEAALTDL